MSQNTDVYFPVSLAIGGWHLIVSLGEMPDSEVLIVEAATDIQLLL
jgi:hypothetical protein